MSNYNTDILIENILKLMEHNSITQKQLGEILGMSQPNISKALNPNDKKNFTLDQVAGISKHFKISIDSLIGNRRGEQMTTSPRATAAFLAKLMETENAIVFKYPIKEEIYKMDYEGNGFQICPSCVHGSEVIDYLAFYLPSYWKVPSNPQTENEQEAFAEATQIGNESSMLPVNEFLHHFTGILEAYKSGSLTEDTYQTVLIDLLKHLRE